MRLVDLVKIDNRFEKSVNLLLDLHVQGKIDGYIPTRSSVKILGEYINEVRGYSGNRASVLIGPYGKGKSHLLLVLLEILAQSTQKSVINALVQRIAAVNQDVANDILDLQSHLGPFLPVIINTGNGSLNRAFMTGLTAALARDELTDVIPDNYYTEALKMIRNWEMHFADTYALFRKKLGKKTPEKFISELEHYDERALETFRSIYPSLTSGGIFNPVVDDEVISVYRSVNRILREKHGYSGIYIVFDEFSKYIEGHTFEGFAEDMKVLQDMCELCNASKDEQLHLTCVAHKSIKTYGNVLSADVLNIFKGVEGRLKEIYFVVSSQNNYELLSDAIAKKDAFKEWASSNKQYSELVDTTYSLKSFSSLFTFDDYKNIVGKGCFPMTPVAAMLLLYLSERIAQNERTIFTYITSKDQHGLARYVEKCRDIRFVGVDSVYDYFVPLFKEDTQNGIHHEWLKADYALTKTGDPVEQAIIKSIAVIHMVNRPDEISTAEKHILLATGIEKNGINRAIKRLEEEKLIEFKKRTGTYEFKNNVGVDVESAIADCIAKRFSKIDTCEVLSQVASDKYVLPKKHNQTFCMTRYFNFAFMTYTQYMSMKSTAYLTWPNRPDGVIVMLVPSEDIDEKEICQHTKNVGDPCLIVCLPNKAMPCDEKAKYYKAVEYLHGNAAFIEDNLVIKKELENLAEDTVAELNEWITNTYYPLGKTFASSGQIKAGPLGLNRLVSDVCDQAYSSTPIINHELINRHDVTAQIAKARNTILDDLLNGRETGKYEAGTSAESTIFRAVMVHTRQDSGLQLAKREIEHFLGSCVENKISFDVIVNTLMSPPFGMRRGVLAFYLLDSILRLENMPIFYLNTKEVVLDVETINNIVRKPQDYYLYVELETVQKSQYVHGLEQMFSDFSEYCRDVDKRNLLAKISCMMQSWYRSLPQTSMTFAEPDFTGQNIRQLTKFRKLFTDLYLNPREIIFDRLPMIFKTDSFDDTLQAVYAAKQEIDTHIYLVKQSAVSIVRKAFNIPETDDLRQSLLSWYDKLPDVAKNSIFTGRTEALLSYIRGISTNDEDEIASRIVRETTGMFIEDWKTGFSDHFEQELAGAIGEISSKKSNELLGDSQKILLVSDNGDQVERFYDYDPENMSSTATFFKSALDDMLDEYDGVLENNEKIGVLMDAIKKLMN